MIKRAKQFYFTGTSEQLYIIIVIILLSIKLWSFIFFTGEINKINELLICTLVTFITVKGWRKLDHRRLIFRTNVIIFIIVVPLISIFASNYFHNQDVFYSVVILRGFLLWQFYFVLHIYRVSPRKIIKALVGIGFIWATINIIQQFTYPIGLFAERLDDATIGREILRAGIYRYMPLEYLYGLFAGIFFFYKLSKKLDIKNLVAFFVILTGFYFYGTRQNLVAFIASCTLMYLLLKNQKNKFVVGVLFLLLGWLVVSSFSEVLFSKIINMTKDEANEDNIRLLAADFYWNTYWPDGLLGKLIGNGRPTINSSYGKEIDYIEKNYMFFTSDIGLLGAYNMYGIMYILNVILINIKAFKMKYYHQDDKWMYFISIGIAMVLIMIEGYDRVSMIPFFCILFYLIDCSYRKKFPKNKINAYTQANELVSN